ncbi:DNA topoisomerase IB [Delftia lacustris]
MPGWRRVRRGKGFSYVDQDGRPVRDAQALERIRKLAIPPAYVDVWICPDARGHLQATGRDARGRKQYRYHPQWQEQRKQVKFDRMREFGRHLPAIRRAVARDLRPGRPQLETVVATIVWLLDCTALRVGNDEYSEANGSFGLTTLRNRHAQVRAGELTLSFKGKSGVAQQARVSDRAVARIVKRCQDLPGQRLFQFVDDEGDVHHVRSEHVNDYIRRICSKAGADEADGQDFSAKDFRTWHASVYALELAMAAAASPAGSRHPGALTFTDLIAEVARRLGNTCTVCRKFYIHPQVLALCEQPGQCPPAATAAPARRTRGLSAKECLFLGLLEPQPRPRRTPPRRGQGASRRPA